MTSRGRIGLNLLYLRPGISGGAETYAAGLLAGLAEINRSWEIVVFLPMNAGDWPIPLGLDARRVICAVDSNKRGRRHLFEQVALPALLERESIDLVHSLAYTGPLFPRRLSIVSVLDANTTAFGRSMKPADRVARSILPLLSAHRADRVLTISEFSRSEIMRAFNLPLQRVDVVYLGCGVLGVTSSETATAFPSETTASLPGKYLVAFSGESPHKNIEALVRIVRRLREEGRLKHELVLIGHPPRRLRARSGEGIHWLGYISTSEVDEVLRRAAWLVFPSLYEGFGLPVLEAMSRGTPVICSRAASLPEVAGDAAVYFDPLRESDIGDVIAEAAADRTRRELLSQAGLRRAVLFSWRTTALRTSDVYDSVLLG